MGKSTRVYNRKMKFLDTDEQAQHILELSKKNPVIAENIDAFITDDNITWEYTLYSIAVDLWHHNDVLCKEIVRKGGSIGFESKNRSNILQ